MKVIIKLLLGIGFGVLLGRFAPDMIIRALLTFEMLFSQFLAYLVPFIIIFFITSGIASLERRCGRILSATVGLSYGSTILAGCFATLIILTVSNFFAFGGLVEVPKSAALTPFLSLKLSMPIDVFTALITAFMFGVGISVTQSTHIKAFFDEGRNIIELIINKLFLPLLPFFIMSVFAAMTHSGNTSSILFSFAKVLLLAVVVHWIYIIALYTIAGIVSGQNPFKALKTMLPVYFTAIGTMSSTATIPVALEQTAKLVKRVNISHFTVPLCATIHLAGSMMTIVICSTAVQIISPTMGMPTFFELIPFVLVLGVMMIAAPGVPGGAVMAALGILQSMLGFNDMAIALMIALYLAQDSFGTACNVTCDGVIAMLVDKYAQNEPSSVLSALQAEKNGL